MTAWVFVLAFTIAGSTHSPGGPKFQSQVFTNKAHCKEQIERFNNMPVPSHIKNPKWDCFKIKLK
jgi:hypothetical protein